MIGKIGLVFAFVFVAALMLTPAFTGIASAADSVCCYWVGHGITFWTDEAGCVAPDFEITEDVNCKHTTKPQTTKSVIKPEMDSVLWDNIRDKIDVFVEKVKTNVKNLIADACANHYGINQEEIKSLLDLNNDTYIDILDYEIYETMDTMNKAQLVDSIAKEAKSLSLGQKIALVRILEVEFGVDAMQVSMSPQIMHR